MILITILARAGSKGLPGKNTKELNGKPLIQYTIEHARKFKEIIESEIIISTDDDDVKLIALANGLPSVHRPAELATDTAPKMPAINHAAEYFESLVDGKVKWVIDLDVCNPMRDVLDIMRAFHQHLETNADITASVTPARRNPFFNMCYIDSNGYAQRIVVNNKYHYTRQECPEFWDFNCCLYIYNRECLKHYESVWQADRLGIYKMPERSRTDIDTLDDFEVVEMMQERLIS